MRVLTVKDLTKSFGGLAAVTGVNIYLDEGELVGLIGPNGAGKTTLFNILTGVYTYNEGSIDLMTDKGMVSLVNKQAYLIARYGVTRTFQNIRLFKKLTALENVKIAMHKRGDYSLFTALFRLPKYYQLEAEIEIAARELLEEVGLGDKTMVTAENLAYGEQRKLEIARALATQPKLLFLDEPAAGMNPHETRDLTRLIKDIRKKYQLTVLLIEHDMSVVMNICERIYVLDYGSIIAEGKPEEIKHNKRVIEAYLGGDA